ncbi:Veg family protein [Defluviitalea phaphyphila]|uniref:Veg family protein n=1 Tax=Defluviitalea phaphyphila TaxID=1473580 RepID=UPI0007312439|nr:Veg family protein [Defluviitalea phaphyphila]
MVSQDLSKIRKNIQEYVGTRVKLKTNKGRRKIIINEGILEDAYPSVFVVKVKNAFEDTFRTISYSYTDILTKTVELSFYKDND